MVDPEVIAETEAQWYRARTRMRQLGLQAAVFAVTLITTIAVPASYLAERLTGGLAAALLTASLMLAAAVPLTGVVWHRMDRQQRLSNRLMKTLRSQLKQAIAEVELESGRRHAQVRRQDFDRSLHTALEMAENEAEVIEVMERAMAEILPRSAAELLLADHSHAHLLRVASSSPDGSVPGCSVDLPDHCPAARRSQLQRFIDSESLDACPKLRRRERGRCSAVCVPVSIMGRTVGVLHAVDEAGELPSAEQSEDLGILADKVGSKIGLLRVIEETQLQAATDSLTGLLNRRSMQNRVRELRRTERSMAVILADLDKFKRLNDTYGHETGDRALRLFAATFSDALRAQDLLSRHGGEEFVAALPGCSGQHARTVAEAVRHRLAAAIAEHGLPPFTCSFGVAEADEGEELAAVIARADRALFEAKRAGRDQIWLSEPSAEQPTGPAPLSIAPVQLRA